MILMKVDGALKPRSNWLFLVRINRDVPFVLDLHLTKVLINNNKYKATIKQLKEIYS